MESIVESFGVYHKKPVCKFSLINKNGVKISAITLGATWYELTTPNKTNLIVNYPNLDDYLTSPFYLGMAIGRTAGRISKGSFNIKNHHYQLDLNDNNNTIHGGSHGFSTINWNGKIEDNKIIFSTRINDGYDSYPGNLETKIIYQLTDDNVLTIIYSGISDKDTLFNPTNHVYFNLGEKQDISNEILQINSKEHLEINENKIPTGKFVNNKSNYAFDFNYPKEIRTAIHELKTKIHQDNFDDAFVLQKHNFNTPIAKLYNPKDNCGVQVCSNRNGLVVFTTNPYPGSNLETPTAIALEFQTLPDAINHKNFGNIILPANVRKEYKVKYNLQF